MIERKRTEDLLDAIDRCKPEDFDGHVDWNTLGLAEKLRWMSRSARFVLAHRRADVSDK